jgi:hypothetical protein
LRGGNSGAAGFADRSLLLWRLILRGCRSLWPAWTALSELRFDVGYVRTAFWFSPFRA